MVVDAINKIMDKEAELMLNDLIQSRRNDSWFDVDLDFRDLFESQSCTEQTENVQLQPSLFSNNYNDNVEVLKQYLVNVTAKNDRALCCLRRYKSKISTIRNYLKTTVPKAEYEKLQLRYEQLEQEFNTNVNKSELEYQKVWKVAQEKKPKLDTASKPNVDCIKMVEKLESKISIQREEAIREETRLRHEISLRNKRIEALTEENNVLQERLSRYSSTVQERLETRLEEVEEGNEKVVELPSICILEEQRQIDFLNVDQGCSFKEITNGDYSTSHKSELKLIISMLQQQSDKLKELAQVRNQKAKVVSLTKTCDTEEADIDGIFKEMRRIPCMLTPLDTALERLAKNNSTQTNKITLVNVCTQTELNRVSREIQTVSFERSELREDEASLSSTLEEQSVEVNGGLYVQEILKYKISDEQRSVDSGYVRSDDDYESVVSPIVEDKPAVQIKRGAKRKINSESCKRIKRKTLELFGSDSETVASEEDKIKIEKQKLSNNMGPSGVSFSVPRSFVKKNVLDDILEAMDTRKVAAKKYKLNPNANEDLDNFVRFSNIPERQLAAVKSLLCNCAATISRAVLQRVLDDVCSKIEKTETPGEPGLTVVKQNLLLLLHILERRRPGTISQFLKDAEVVILSAKDVGKLSSVSRLYVALCKSQQYMCRVRAIIYEVFYRAKMFSVTFLYIVISCWPEVIPCKNHPDFNCLPVRPVIQVIRLKKKAPYLRNYLKQIHGYSMELEDDWSLLKELLDAFLEKRTRLLETVIIMFCANIKSTSVENKIETYLQSTLCNSKDVDQMCAAITLTGFMMQKCYTTGNQARAKLSQLLNNFSKVPIREIKAISLSVIEQLTTRTRL